MHDNLHPFNWEHYRRILASGHNAGYNYIGFSDPQSDKSIYLRHDIDNDIGIAHRMALVEHEMGVKSTYLVLVRSANYNPAEGRCLRMLEEMSEMGHHIGLHFSLVDHPLQNQQHDLADLIRRDADLLEILVQRPVKIFGFHNPNDSVPFQIEVPGLINTYHNQFFRESYYISESNMSWRKGCPCELIPRDGHRSIQLLIHPLSFADHLTSDYDVLVHFLWLKMTDLLHYNAEQNRVLRDKKLALSDVLKELHSKGNRE